jgi:hypothetical protein
MSVQVLTKGSGTSHSGPGVDMDFGPRAESMPPCSKVSRRATNLNWSSNHD